MEKLYAVTLLLVLGTCKLNNDNNYVRHYVTLFLSDGLVILELT